MKIRNLLAGVLALAFFAAPAVGQVATSRNISTAQVSCDTTATKLADFTATRESITITNTGTTAVYIGGSSVSASNGALLPGVLGATLTLRTQSALYCIAGTAETVTTLQTY